MSTLYSVGEMRTATQQNKEMEMFEALAITLLMAVVAIGSIEIWRG